METIMRGILSFQLARENGGGPRISWLPWRQDFDGRSLPWPTIGTKLWIWINAFDGLEGGHEEFHMEMRGVLNSLAESWKAQMDALKDSLQVEIAAIKEEIKEVKGDWSLCKMAVTQGGGDNEGISKLSSLRQSRFDNKGRRNGDKPKLSCFLCDGNHFARDCPQRAKLSALIRDDEEEPHQEKAKASNSRKNKVDKGRQHGGTAYLWSCSDVRLHIGAWCGQVDFTVVPMDDYPIVLGMEFLDGVQAFPIPFAETMCIMGEGSACMVPLARKHRNPRPCPPCNSIKRIILLDKRPMLRFLPPFLPRAGELSSRPKGGMPTWPRRPKGGRSGQARIGG
ncbi:hypothetical protein Acr_16g0003430 [Actinidia rufa]|uniref:Uncharacterized protein n=1 Tax=Actinidia rufa TaxID=165716 RepID=A0A7J0FYE7_9ERIC|nr:hypothetical protein Acr_16g0003430 [Actinidia rufa]